MVVGLGTGSTAYFVVEGLGARVAAGLKIVGIPTSERTATQARGLAHPARELCRAPAPRPDDRRRRRGGARHAQPDQGARRRAVAREDRRRGQPAARHRRRSGEAGRPPRRPHAGAGRGDAIRLAVDARPRSPSSAPSRRCATRRRTSPLSPTAATTSSIAASPASPIPARLERSIDADRRRRRERAVCRPQLGGRRRFRRTGSNC